MAEPEPESPAEIGGMPTFRMPNVSSTRIEFRPLLLLHRGQPRSDHSGRYIDVFVQEGDRWLIKLRLPEVLWRVENSVTSRRMPSRTRVSTGGRQ